jgi:hypothetical protein
MNVGLKFSFNTRQIEQALDSLGSESVIAVIFNDAQSKEGKYYWTWVNDGRGPVYPINAQVLHWTENGEDVFAMYAGPSAPRHIREKALTAIKAKSIAAVVRAGEPLSRKVLVQFVNDLAKMAVGELQENTPGNGPLKNSYRIEKAT